MVYLPDASVVAVLVPSLTVAPTMAAPSLASVTDPVMLPERIIWLREKLATVVPPGTTFAVKDELW